MPDAESDQSDPDSESELLEGLLKVERPKVFLEVFCLFIEKIGGSHGDYQYR